MNLIRQELIHLLWLSCLLSACHRPQDLQPGALHFDRARQVFNKAIQHSPAHIFLCKTEADVRYALKFARQRHLPVRIRAGGHSYEGLSVANGAVVIDVQGLTSFEYQASDQSVTVGAGFKLYPLYQKLAEHQRTISAGGCPTVGIAGMTLGGGVGFASRALGLTVDNVLGLEMVDFQGRLLRVNPHSHADLFWALMGAGHGNYGVVTKLKFKTHAAREVTVFRLEADWRHLRPLSRLWFKLRDQAPRELMLFLRFTKASGKRTVSIFGQYAGTAASLQKFLQPVYALDNTFRARMFMETMNSMGATDYWAGIGDHNRGHYAQDLFKNRRGFKAHSMYLSQAWPSSVYDIIDKFYQRSDIDNVFTVLDSYGGAINDRSHDFNAFAHRHAIASLQSLSYWTQERDRDRQSQWNRDLYAALKPFAQGAYRNHEDLNLEDWPHQYYGDHLPRLKFIKQKYDPCNVFDYELSIPLP